ncbi:MAG: DUF1614 domain-containing protein [Deltaproteobacteria bacterium]|nr:DUF1614 domain-containing protein [Deltaproteobacteria bacterium]
MRFSPGCLPLIAIVGFLLLLPLFFAHVMLAALSKLGLAPGVAFLALVGIIFGGSVNIPFKRIPRADDYVVDPLVLFGFGRMLPRLRVVRGYTTLAVNVGGCVIPCAIALYQCARIIAQGPGAVLVTIGVSLLSIGVCYRLAQPLPGVGIAMPALIPPLLAAIPSVVLMPDFAPPIAFVAGVVGPLVGADLLHLAEIKTIPTGMASIGGAGTFDGIVLSGLMAALLA